MTDWQNLFANKDYVVSEWVSSFLTAHEYRYILGYLVPYHGMVDLHKRGDIIKAI